MPVLCVVLLPGASVGVHAFCLYMSRWPNMSTPHGGMPCRFHECNQKSSKKAPRGKHRPNSVDKRT
eukprot:6146164-Pyramimonas_sp.AAC.1